MPTPAEIHGRAGSWEVSNSNAVELVGYPSAGIDEAESRIGAAPGKHEPLRSAHADDTVLIVARRAGEPPFDTTIAPLISAFADQVTVALDTAARQRVARQLDVYADRDRIARDLHDLVIQRLFAAGLSIQSLRRFATDASADARISEVTDELDESIRELRNTIYSLRTAETDKEPFSSTIFNTVHEGLRNSSITPRISVAGGIDGIPSSTAQQLTAVLSEAVSNALRHSAASRLSISVTAEDGRAELVVEDDGVGFRDPRRTSGLANMEHRAVSAGGNFSIDSSPGSGTRITCSLPLHR